MGHLPQPGHGRPHHPGTEVEVDIRGRVFPATITGKQANGRFPIAPLSANIGYFSATARQIKKVLRRTRDTQLQLGSGTG